MSGHEGTIWGIAYLPGGKRVVSCSNDKTVRIWDVEKGEQEGTSMVHEGGVHALAVTKDGKRILSGGEDKRIIVWDVETHERIEEWADHTGKIHCIALSPDDRLAASGGMSSGEIVIREMRSGNIKHSIDAGSSVLSLCFSPNGEKLACRSYFDRDHVIQVYDVDGGKLVLGPIKGHKSWVRCVLWSLDGSQLFSASEDRTIRCWNSETGKPIGKPWAGHTSFVTFLSLSPDGTKLASTSYDQTVRFWDTQSGKPIEQPLQHDNFLYAVAFSPCGKFVAYGDKKVSILRVPWWVEGRKQVITTLTYLPTLFLNIFVTAGTSFATAATCRPPSDRTILSTTCTSWPFHPHTYCNAGSALSRHCTGSQSYVSHCCKFG
ncbi:hypothetical protein PAXINDRAFT_92705 [Paxillus involutus ATCC 200175]|uniref:WD40 repeat-like protein n=1 Tax=Paxillus involutus ATCC 200175 TaxID=664439 RepID=A0A0C9TCL4_PAXIN|nr:hypothetical protein PAXINDRAFT_92705 [Paxillus involutus ATCC 200175]